MRLAMTRVPAVLATAVLATAVVGATLSAAAAAPVSALTAATGSAGVSAGFQPVAASFVSPSWGVVLGATGCSGPHRCRAQLVRTSDGGSHWSSLPAPGLWVNSGPKVVNQVEFVSKQDGYLFNQYSGKVFWATTDGGSHWLPYALGRPLTQIQAASSRVYALAGTQLWDTTVGSNAWSKVTGVTGDWLGAYGSRIWVGSNTKLWTRQGNGAWHEYAFGCPKHYGLAGISAASATHVAFLVRQLPGHVPHQQARPHLGQRWPDRKRRWSASAERGRQHRLRGAAWPTECLHDLGGHPWRELPGQVG